MKEHNPDKKDFLMEDDETTVKQLIGGLDKIDQWNPVFTPDLQWFEQRVELEKQKLRKKQIKDLMIFLSLAVLILVVVIAVVYRQPIVFLYFQLIGIVLLPLAFNKRRKRVSNE